MFRTFIPAMIWVGLCTTIATGAGAQNGVTSTEGSVTSSDRSGHNTGRPPLQLRQGNDWLLAGITFGERRDRPCYIKAHFYRIFRPSNPEKQTADDISDTCDGGSGNHKTVQITNWERPRTRPGVVGLQVCTNDNNRRLKGIRLSAVRLAPRDLVVRPGGTTANGGTIRPEIREFPRPSLGTFEEKRFACNNNNEWRESVSCSEEKDAAVGIAITHDRNGTVQGLALLCQEAYYQTP